MRRFLLSLIVLATAYGLTTRYAVNPPIKERYVAVVDKVAPTVVTISVAVHYTKNGKKLAGVVSGSGVLISPNGHILSCAHLFWAPFIIDSIAVEKADGWIFPATLLYKEDRKDLSLLKIEDKPLHYAQLARPDALQVGQEVIAIGAPMGLVGSVSTGIISALHRDQFNYDMLQMSAPINPGNSGGPLFNLKGEVVGINVLVLPSTKVPVWSGLGFAVSASEINRFLVYFRGLEKVIRG